MNPSKPNDLTPPALDRTATSENASLPVKESKEKPQIHPDQTGAEYGGYGHADNSFGRDAGSSSEEGGQGGDEPGSDSLSAPKPIKDGSNDSLQTAPSEGTSQHGSASVKKPD